MPDEPGMVEARNDDLDLVTLADRTFSFFRKYGKIMAIGSIAGLLIGLLLFFVLPKKYVSTLLVHSFTLTNTEHINIISDWDDLLKKKEYEAVASDMGVDPEMLKKVSKIEASEIQKLYIQNNPNGFMIEATVKDTSILDELQEGIIYGLENGTYLKAKLESRRANLRQLIEEVKVEMKKLDSTKKDIENSIRGNSRSSSSYIVDITGITGQMMGLNEKLLGYQEELRFTRAVQVLHNFSRFKKPDSPKLFKLLVLGLIGGFAIGYFISVYRYVIQRIRMRHALQS